MIINPNCLPKLLITILLVVIAVTLTFNYSKTPKTTTTTTTIIEQPKPTRGAKRPLSRRSESDDEIKIIVDPIRKYDVNKLINPLESPVRRDERSQLNYLGMYGLTSIPTRGYIDSYSQFGILTRVVDNPNDKENRILKLFGRQRYSNSYDYYTAINMGYDQIKVKIREGDTRELYDGDVVTISELNNAQYTVQLYKKDEYIYNPYVL